MDTTLHLSEGAGVLDVYDHEEEEGDEKDINDNEFDDEKEEYDDDEEEVIVDDYREEEELEDDLTRQEKEKEEEEYNENFSPRQFQEEEAQEENQQVDPSLLALAAAQQQDDIIPPSSVREERNRTASTEIKKTVYDFVMTSKNNIPPPPSPPPRAPSPENVRPSPISPPPPPPEEEEQIDRSPNNSDGSVNAYYSFLMERHDPERYSPKEIPSRGGISDASAEKYPTEFSANLIHGDDDEKSSQSLPSSVTVPPRFVSDATFPIEREVSDESLIMAAKEEAFLIPPPSPPPKQLPPEKTPSTLADAFSKVNDVLGGKEAMKKIDENMQAAVLKAKVQMLRDTTKHLRCSYMVDLIFGEGDAPKKPGDGDLRRLKNIIAGELTLNEFIKSSEVTDISSAELFRRSNENLEMVQRQQIMSNPLFSEISSASSLFSRVRQKKTENEVEGEVVASNNNNLHMELFNLLNCTPGEKEDPPCYRLSDRVSFLNHLIDHKTANTISWTRLVNLVSHISSQAAVVLFGDGDEQNNMNGNNAIKDMNMSSIGMDLLFGAASDTLERNVSRVCVDIGELALYLNIPVVLLQWPQEFIRTDDYKNILTRSISSFTVKMAIPTMYIIDQIMFDDEDSSDEEEEQQQHNLELFSERDKKASINKLYNEIRSGRGRERDLMRSIFHGQQQNIVSSNSLLDASTVYSAAASIIDHKISVFDDIMNGAVKYLNRRKQLISAALIKLLKKAKLNITVYCIKNKLDNVSAKCDKKTDNEETVDAPMQNLMYRSSALPGKKRWEEGSVVARRRDGAPASIKRPPPSVLSRRIKRLKQWGETISSDESEDEDTDSG